MNGKKIGSGSFFSPTWNWRTKLNQNQTNGNVSNHLLNSCRSKKTGHTTNAYQNNWDYAISQYTERALRQPASSTNKYVYKMHTHIFQIRTIKCHFKPYFVHVLCLLSLTLSNTNTFVGDFVLFSFPWFGFHFNRTHFSCNGVYIEFVTKTKITYPFRMKNVQLKWKRMKRTKRATEQRKSGNK